MSALKLFDPSLKIRGPAVVKQAKFIRDRKVPTKYNTWKPKFASQEKLEENNQGLGPE